MNKFVSPEISVVMFSAADTVLTASANGGYEDSMNNGSLVGLFNITSYNTTDGSGDGMPL